MLSLRAGSIATLNELQHNLLSGLKQVQCLQQAAQTCADLIYRSFEEEVVLVRLYATLPFRLLPAPDQKFVTNLADTLRVRSQLQPNTIVLSLLGTHGTRPAWNDRYKSQGHLGIPLASASSVQGIPMIAALMNSMGIGLDWLDRQETDVVVKKMGTLAGVFYVADAATALDGQNRKIVPAQDFVAANQVKTVFGLGGSYINGTFLTLIVFSHETVPPERVQVLTPLISTIKTSTMMLAARNAIFAP